MESFRSTWFSLCSRAVIIFAKTALAGATAMLITPSLWAANAFVRVNQLGYEVAAESRAYLMSKTSESGAIFRVVNSGGETKFTAPIGTSLGTWGKFTVY